MAKRKRLTPANPAFLETGPPPARSAGAAPIAAQAREASASAAAETLARTLTEAREGGRMVLSVPLEAVDPDYLTRDRVAVEDEEMQALKASLRARGQQMPVDLVDLGGGRYGLISGWRRCMALAALRAETGEARFAEVLGLLRRPADAAEAYHAMVEENEIRAALSHYERARIVCKAVEQGVFGTDRAALQGLFGAASRPRRSKIGSFLGVVRALDGALRFPAAIGERLGLALARALDDDPALGPRLRARLDAAAAPDAEAEQALLRAALSPAPVQPQPQPESRFPVSKEPGAASASVSGSASGAIRVAAGITLRMTDGRITLEGRGVTPDLRDALAHWLGQRD